MTVVRTEEADHDTKEQGQMATFVPGDGLMNCFPFHNLFALKKKINK